MLQASPGGACQIWSYLGPSGGWYKPMQVYGESDAMLSVSTTGGVTDLRAVNQVNNTWRWMRVQEGGVLIVGSGSPAADAKITVGGRVYGNSPRYEGGYYINCPDTSIGRVLRASGYLEWTSDVGAIGTNYFLSDIRKKENITLSTFNSSALISKIEFIGFDWKPDSGNSGHVDVGVSAQQLQTLDNRLVNELSDGSLVVNEPALVAHMAKALQEQQAIITALTARIEALEAK